MGRFTVFHDVGAPIYGGKLPRPKMKAPWPDGIDYGGDNAYPNVYPYNITDKAVASAAGFLKGEDYTSW